MIEELFKITEGPLKSPCVLVKSQWSNEISEYILENKIKELHLCTEKIKGKDLLFLKDLPHLDSFIIVALTIDNIYPVNYLSSLRFLNIMTYCNTEIDFSKFPLLERCFLYWREKAKSLFNCVTLKELYLDHYTGKDTVGFSNLINLEKLTIYNSRISDLRGLTNLKKLKVLNIANFRTLESLDGIEELVNLEELYIQGCRKIKSIDKLSGLTNLKKLDISRNGSIESLKPIESLSNLETFFFVESTNVLDGDMNPLLNLKNIKDTAFQNRKHYSHKCEYFWKLYKANEK